jgi:hypothetical protein
MSKRYGSRCTPSWSFHVSNLVALPLIMLWTQVNCSLCKHSIERELWDLHASIRCPQRMLACQYCEFELPAVDLFEHQVCIYISHYTISPQKLISNANTSVTMIMYLCGAGRMWKSNRILSRMQEVRQTSRMDWT